MAETGLRAARPTVIPLFRAIRAWVMSDFNSWDEDSETVCYLRREKEQAIATAEQLRKIGIPLTGNILEDNVTGAASRYRRLRDRGGTT